MADLDYKETPVQRITTEDSERRNISLIVKREDLNHPAASGNKWWKLKYNLAEAQRLGYNTVLTFGGAYSNHIYATAAAAAELNIHSIGVIRGEESLPLNPTLSFAASSGMKLLYVSRSEYKRKTEAHFIDRLHRDLGEFFVIPEGGSNKLAVKGCKEWGEKLAREIDFDMVFLPVGTGGTMAGLIAAMSGKKTIIGIPVFRESAFLRHEIRRLLEVSSEQDIGNWDLLGDYHHGGYAKTTPALIDFIRRVKRDQGLPVDHVYTAKMLWAVTEEIKSGRIPRGAKVLLLHTGGLQGLLSELAKH